MAGKCALGYQLYSMGLLSEPRVPFDCDIIRSVSWITVVGRTPTDIIESSFLEMLNTASSLQYFHTCIFPYTCTLNFELCTYA